MDLRHSHDRFWEDIEGKGAAEAASLAGAEAENGDVLVRMAGQTYRVRPGERAVIGPDGGPARFTASVVLVTYLAMADGTPPEGRWVNERMLPLGDAYFRGPHLVPYEILLRPYGDRPERLHEALGRVDGRPVDFGDAGAEIPALPRVPLRVGLWKADDEFEAEGRILVDPTAHRYLILDGLLTLCTLVFKRLAP